VVVCFRGHLNTPRSEDDDGSDEGDVSRSTKPGVLRKLTGDAPFDSATPQVQRQTAKRVA
jgi:hypothetical protein